MGRGRLDLYPKQSNVESKGLTRVTTDNYYFNSQYVVYFISFICNHKLIQIFWAVFLFVF